VESGIASFEKLIKETLKNIDGYSGFNFLSNQYTVNYEWIADHNDKARQVKSVFVRASQISNRSKTIQLTHEALFTKLPEYMQFAVALNLVTLDYRISVNTAYLPHKDTFFYEPIPRGSRFNRYIADAFRAYQNTLTLTVVINDKTYLTVKYRQDEDSYIESLHNVSSTRDKPAARPDDVYKKAFTHLKSVDIAELTTLNSTSSNDASTIETDVINEINEWKTNTLTTKYNQFEAISEGNTYLFSRAKAIENLLLVSLNSIAKESQQLNDIMRNFPENWSDPVLKSQIVNLQIDQLLAKMNAKTDEISEEVNAMMERLESSSPESKRRLFLTEEEKYIQSYIKELQSFLDEAIVIE
jgi:hypothetical protein